MKDKIKVKRIALFSTTLFALLMLSYIFTIFISRTSLFLEFNEEEVVSIVKIQDDLFKKEYVYFTYDKSVDKTYDQYTANLVEARFIGIWVTNKYSNINIYGLNVDEETAQILVDSREIVKNHNSRIGNAESIELVEKNPYDIAPFIQVRLYDYSVQYKDYNFKYDLELKKLYKNSTDISKQALDKVGSEQALFIGMSQNGLVAYSISESQDTQTVVVLNLNEELTIFKEYTSLPLGYSFLSPSGDSVVLLINSENNVITVDLATDNMETYYVNTSTFLAPIYLAHDIVVLEFLNEGTIETALTLDNI